MLEVKQATTGDVLAALSFPRPSDKPEFGSQDRRQDLLRVAAASDVLRSAWVGDVMLCVFGAYRLSLLSKIGVVWFVGTPALDERPLTALRPARRELARIVAECGYDRVVAWVFRRNKISARWLRWLGFRKSGDDKRYFQMEYVP